MPVAKQVLSSPTAISWMQRYPLYFFAQLIDDTAYYAARAVCILFAGEIILLRIVRAQPPASCIAYEAPDQDSSFINKHKDRAGMQLPIRQIDDKGISGIKARVHGASLHCEHNQGLIVIAARL